MRINVDDDDDDDDDNDDDVGTGFLKRVFYTCEIKFILE